MTLNRMMNLRWGIIYILVVLTGAGCSVATLSVVIDYDRDARFSNYKTFYWSDDFQMDNGKEEDPLFYNTLIKKRLKIAIEKEMTGRGYVLDKSNPDLLIDSRIIVQQKSANQSYYPFSPYYHGYYYGYYGSQYPSEHKEGGVVIEFVDRARRQLVWQGYVPDVLHTNTEDKQKEIREAVSLIFAKYEFRAD